MNANRGAQRPAVDPDERDPSSGVPGPVPGVPADITRRRILMRGGSAAVPMILTLHSGAALARSSNLIGIATGPSEGSYQCLSENSYTPDGNKLDLGDNPTLNVTRISTDGTYSREDNNNPSNRVDGRAMCAEGGDFYERVSGGWQQVSVQKGSLVSFAALGSFVGRGTITFTDI